MAVNYVKFYRGTPLAFENVIKNNDTLYFITETDSNKGSLYLGNKLIGNNIADITDLEDILLSNLNNNDLLIYDENNQKWVNKTIIDAIGLMIGAKEDTQGGAGLVPAPGIGQQEMFLRGDGIWAIPENSSNVSLKEDGKTISIENSIVSLKNFGKQYYKYIAATSTEPAKYVLQIVDENNPWKEYLEPKVIKENDELIIGWFEPNPTTIEGVQDQIIDLSSSFDVITQNLNTNYYTKSETESYVAQEISKQNHLIRKTFDSIEAAEAFILLEEHPENYIYMILSTDIQKENNKYNEYIYVEGFLEKVGSWETDLNDYVTQNEFQNINTKVNNIEILLNNKVEKDEISNLTGNLNNIDSRVTNIEEFLNSEYFKPLDDIQADLNIVKDAITWKEL